MSTHFSRHSGGSGQPLLSTQKPCVSSSSQGHVPSKVHSVPGLHADTGTHPEDTESKHVPHAHDAPGAALPTDGLCPFAPRSFGKHRNPERSRQTVVCWLWAGTAGHCVQKLLRQAAFECSAPGDANRPTPGTRGPPPFRKAGPAGHPLVCTSEPLVPVAEVTQI